MSEQEERHKLRHLLLSSRITIIIILTAVLVIIVLINTRIKLRNLTIITITIIIITAIIIIIIKGIKDFLAWTLFCLSIFFILCLAFLAFFS